MGRASEIGLDAAAHGPAVAASRVRDWFEARVMTSLEGAAVVDLACGARHTLLLTNRGDVFAFGCNWDGQLGLGDTTDRHTPTPLKAFALLRALHSRVVVQVACGAEHALAIDNSGALYAWGSGKAGQLGNGLTLESAIDASLHFLVPRPVLALHGVCIVQVASGASHVLALSDDGSVYAWGSARNGRLGLGSTQRAEAVPRRIAELQHRTLAVACGWSHSMAIVGPSQDTGLLSLLRARADSRQRAHDEQMAMLFVWGRGTNGRLGTGDENDRLKPTALTTALPRNVVAVAGGHHHSAAIDADGNLFTFGLNNYGQLGLGPDAERSVLLPTRVASMRARGVVGVACGGYHTVAWTDSGRMYSFGLHVHGQLGLGLVELAPPAPTSYVAPASVWASLGVSMIIDDDDDDDNNDDAAVAARSASIAVVASASEAVAVASTPDNAGGRRGSLDFQTMSPTQPRKGAALSAFESDVARLASTMERPTVDVPTRVRTGTLLRRRKPGVTRAVAGWRTTFAIVEDEKAASLAAPISAFTAAVAPEDVDDDSVGEDDGKGAFVATSKPAMVGAVRGPGTPVRTKPVVIVNAAVGGGDDYDGDDDDVFRTALADLHSVRALPVANRSDDGAVDVYLNENDDDDEDVLQDDDDDDDSDGDDGSAAASGSAAVEIASARSASEAPPESVGDFEHFDTLLRLATAAYDAKAEAKVDSPRLAPMMTARRPHASTLAPQLQPQVWRDELQLTAFWLNEVLPDWDRRYTQRLTKAQWRRGVPTDARGAVWQRAIGNDLQVTAAVYAQLVAQAAAVRHADEAAAAAATSEAQQQHHHDDDESPASRSRERRTSAEQSARLIEVDLPRTMPQLGAFKRGTMRAELQEVLEAYSQYNERTHYAQGMSYVAAMLHLHLASPFDTFVALANLLDRDLFQAMFSASIKDMARHIKVFDALVQRLLPNLARHFAALSITTDYYLLDWFMTIFSRALPYGSSARIWDCALLEGDQFLYQAAVGLLKAHQKLLLKQDFEQCLHTLRALPRAANEEELLRTILSIKMPVSDVVLCFFCHYFPLTKDPLQIEFDSLIDMMRADYERARAPGAGVAVGRSNLLAAVRDNYLSTGASFITPTRLSQRPVMRSDDDDEAIPTAPRVARRLDL